MSIWPISKTPTRQPGKEPSRARLTFETRLTAPSHTQGQMDENTGSAKDLQHSSSDPEAYTSLRSMFCSGLIRFLPSCSTTVSSFTTTVRNWLLAEPGLTSTSQNWRSIRKLYYGTTSSTIPKKLSNFPRPVSSAAFLLRLFLPPFKWTKSSIHCEKG